MTDSEDSTPPAAAAAAPPKQKRVVLPKNRRKYTRTLKKTAVDSAEHVPPPDVPPAAAAQTSSLAERISSKQASRPPSVKELTAELTRIHQLLKNSEYELSQLRKQYESLQKTNRTLTESVEKARKDLRDERKSSSASEQSNKRKISQLEVMVEEAESSAAAKYHAQLEKEQVSHIISISHQFKNNHSNLLLL